MTQAPGSVILFGSGETAASGRRIYEWVLRRFHSGVEIAVLETPAGFEPNSDQVADRVARYLREHLRNYQPRVTVVPARKRGTSFSPDDPIILAPILTADIAFLGPGSPTYAVRQLQGSLAWHYVVARHRLGAAVILASAAGIAAGAYALPVYEIYKVGADLHWSPGLNLFGPYGLSLVVVPHWNNAEGGDELDTSHCFMGAARFGELLRLLPSGITVVGIDEHTALALDVATAGCRVLGLGGVTLLRSGREERFERDETFSMRALGPFHVPAPAEGIPDAVWQTVVAAPGTTEAAPPPPLAVLELSRAREAARARRDWDQADALRRQIAKLGWQVADTPTGPKLSPAVGKKVA